MDIAAHHLPDVVEISVRACQDAAANCRLRVLPMGPWAFPVAAPGVHPSAGLGPNSVVIPQGRFVFLLV